MESEVFENAKITMPFERQANFLDRVLTNRRWRVHSTR